MLQQDAIAYAILPQNEEDICSASVCLAWLISLSETFSLVTLTLKHQHKVSKEQKQVNRTLHEVGPVARKR